MASKAKVIIEQGVPIPIGYKHSESSKLRKIIAAMKVGESFTYDRRNVVINAAKTIKVKITTRKISGEGFRIWRME